MYFYARDLADRHYGDLVAYQPKLMSAAELAEFGRRDGDCVFGPWNHLLRSQLGEFLEEFGDAGAEALAVLCRFRAFGRNVQVGTHPRDDRDYTGSPEIDAASRALCQFAEICRALDLAGNPDVFPEAIEKMAPRFVAQLPQSHEAREAVEALRAELRSGPGQANLLPWRVRLQMDDFLAEFGNAAAGALEVIAADPRFWTEIEQARRSDPANSHGEQDDPEDEAYQDYGTTDANDRRDVHLNTASWYLAELTAIARFLEVDRYPALAPEAGLRMTFHAYPLACEALGYDASGMMTAFAHEQGLNTAVELVWRVLSARPWLIYVNAPDDKAAVMAERYAVLRVGCDAWRAAPGQERLARLAGAELAMAGALACDLRGRGGRSQEGSVKMDVGDYIIFMSLIALVGWIAWLITAPLR